MDPHLPCINYVSSVVALHVGAAILHPLKRLSGYPTLGILRLMLFHLVTVHDLDLIWLPVRLRIKWKSKIGIDSTVQSSG